MNHNGRPPNPDFPFATISYAVQADLCTASNGDVILVAPGHTESITNATAVTTAGSCILDIAGVSVIGLGTGSLVPTLTMTTATGATLSITAANCRVKNLKFVSAIDACTSAITLAAGADGTVIEDCVISPTTEVSAVEFLSGIKVATTCNNCRFSRNSFRWNIATATTAPADGIYFVGSSYDTIIEDNVLIGPFSVAGINAVADPTLSVGLIVRRNKIYVSGTLPGISIHTNFTLGFVYDNYVYATNTDNRLAYVVTTLAAFNNYCNGSLTTSGVLCPAADGLAS